MVKQVWKQMRGFDLQSLNKQLQEKGLPMMRKASWEAYKRGFVAWKKQGRTTKKGKRPKNGGCATGVGSVLFKIGQCKRRKLCATMALCWYIVARHFWSPLLYKDVKALALEQGSLKMSI